MITSLRYGPSPKVYAGHVLGIFTQLSPAETFEHFVFQFRSGISVSWAALVKAGGILHQGTGTAGRSLGSIKQKSVASLGLLDK